MQLQNLWIAFIIISLFFSTASAWGQTSSTPRKNIKIHPNQELTAPRQAIRERLSSNNGNDLEAGDVRLLALMDYYEKTNFKPIWITDKKANAKAKALIKAFAQANMHGLHPSDYHPASLSAKLKASNNNTLADLEVSLSNTLVSYAHHLHAGRLKPHIVNREIKIFPKGPDLQEVLTHASQTNNINTFIATLPPQTPHYKRLKKQLSLYRSLKKTRQDWTKLPKGLLLKPGMDDSYVHTLRQRLIESGDIRTDAHQGSIYNGVLVHALKHFQMRHGLAVDGVLGKQSLAELNTSLTERIRQLEINLERRRWLPEKLGDYYVFVNLADQFLKVVRYDQQEKRERTIHTAFTIVGKNHYRTPVFSKPMTYLEFNPNWNVPYSIATKEFLPKLKNNSTALAKHNIRLLQNGREIAPQNIDWSRYNRRNFPFRLQQKSGPKNALGQVKFMLPNRYAIYLHDTPAKQLFSHPTRAFSHGCIRVQYPLDLANVLLSRQNWNRTKIDKAVNKGKRRVVKLKRPIPVHITYFTAWVNKDGTLHFRKDIYGRDKILSRAFFNQMHEKS